MDVGLGAGGHLWCPSDAMTVDEGEGGKGGGREHVSFKQKDDLCSWLGIQSPNCTVYDSVSSLDGGFADFGHDVMMMHDDDDNDSGHLMCEIARTSKRAHTPLFGVDCREALGYTDSSCSLIAITCTTLNPKT